jgi:hypothetical protein
MITQYSACTYFVKNNEILKLNFSVFSFNSPTFGDLFIFNSNYFLFFNNISENIKPFHLFPKIVVHQINFFSMQDGNIKHNCKYVFPCILHF